MAAFFKWAICFSLGVVLSGNIAAATISMMRLAADAQQHSLSYGKFSKTLTASWQPGSKRSSKTKIGHK